MNIISEGKVRFYASVNTDGKISKELEVFYNPLMKFNRDVSVMLLNSLHEIDGLEEIDSGVEISGNSLCRIGGIIEEMGFMIIGIVLK